MRPSERDRRFIAYLGGLTQRSARVELAASLGRPAGESLRAVRWLAPWTRAMGRREFALHHLVAALYATHAARVAQTAPPPHENLGAALAHLARARGMTPSLERRFIALLEADADDIGHHLRRVISLVRDADILFDWAQLLTDLRNWEDPERRVQLSWAKAFWAGQYRHAADDSAVSAASASADCCSPPDASVRTDGEYDDVRRVAPAAELRPILPEP